MTHAHHVTPSAAPDLDAALDALRAQGLRASSARRLVLQALYRADGPLTAEHVAERIGARADVASVYRNLETLESVGLVRHFHLGHGPSLYVRAGTGVREYLACDACGRVEAVAPAELDAVRDRIRADHGWEVHFAHFPISGLCPACAKDGHAHP